MDRNRATLQRFGRDQRGATAIEYGLICSVLSLGLFTTYSLVGQELTSLFQRLATAFTSMM